MVFQAKRGGGTVAPAELVEARHEKTHADPKTKEEVGKGIARIATAIGGGRVRHEWVGLLVRRKGGDFEPLNLEIQQNLESDSFGIVNHRNR